jgi:hypothetical protein
MLITETKYAPLFIIVVEAFGSPFTQLFFSQRTHKRHSNGKIGE